MLPKPLQLNILLFLGCLRWGLRTSVVLTELDFGKTLLFGI